MAILDSHSMKDGPLYGIGDVSKICDVPAYTIRFWEKEFGDFLSVSRTIGKQRRYNDADISQIEKIKNLLYVERYSIQGAKRVLGASNDLTFSLSKRQKEFPDTKQLAFQIAQVIQDQLTKAQYA